MKVLFVLACALIAWSDAALAAVEIGKPVGGVPLTALAGDTIEMKNFDERPATVVVFLSTRCAVTRDAIAEVVQAFNKSRLVKVLFVGVFPNKDESADEVRTFAQRSGMIFPAYRDPAGTVTKQFGATKTPEVFIIDRNGSLGFHGGLQNAADRQAFSAALSSTLRKEKIVTPSVPVAGTPIGGPGSLLELADPYGSISFTAEHVFERIPAVAAVHCSTICEAANKDLLCLWYGGSYESADDQTLYLARKKPTEGNWEAPHAFLQNAQQPPGNGVIFRGNDDRLWIVWCRMEGTRPMGRGSGWDRCRLFFRTSTDQGVTWSEDQQLLDETLWCVPRNPPATLADGSLLLPVEGWLDKEEGSHFLVLEKGVDRWKRAGFTSGGSQPGVVQRQDGSLLALLRHARNITQIESRDGGNEWTKAVATKLKNPDSGISMTRLANGHLLLVYNDSQTKRTPLSVVRSVDEGKTWEAPWNLESNPGEYSYPCIIQGADGMVHVTYTDRRYSIKHVAFNEDWLLRVERPD